MVVELRGPTAELLTASERVERGIGMPPGLLARAVAPRDDGIVLINLWASEEQRVAANEDPVHHRVLQESGIEALVRERVVRRFDGARLDVAPPAATARRL